MTKDNMVERVARALCRVTRVDPDALGVDRQPRWKGWVQFAEAAIATMHGSGSGALRDALVEARKYIEAVIQHPSGFDEKWQLIAKIDAALANTDLSGER